MESPWKNLNSNHTTPVLPADWKNCPFKKIHSAKPPSTVHGHLASMGMGAVRIIGSAEALPILCVRYIRWERERERERERYRERRKWRHHCRAKIGHEFTCSLCQKFAQLAMSLHFPLPKTRTFRFSLHTSRLSLHWEVTIVALKFAVGSHFPLPKIFSPSLFPLFQMAPAARRVIENRRQTIKSCPVLLFFPSKKWIKLIPKTIGK